MTESWVDRYRPEKWSELQGNNSSLKDIRSWVEEFEPGDQPRLLHGDQGTGKTSTAEVAAKETGRQLVEINASDKRTSGGIDYIISQIRSVTDDKLVLVDEMDSFPRSADMSKLADALEDPPNPVILTCNEDWKVSDKLKRRCKKHEFKLNKSSKKAKIRDIAEQEDLDLSKKEIGILATRDDLRSVINDMQRYANGGEISWDEREMETDEYNSVGNIIEGKTYVGSSVAPNDFVYWLNENISQHFDGLEEWVSYDAISLSDKWLGRADETGNYHWWAYAGTLQEQVGNLRITEPWQNYIRRSYPTYFRLSRSHVNDGSSLASLYRKVKRMDSGVFEFSGDFVYFREFILPEIKKLDDEAKRQFALRYELEGNELAEIGLKEEDLDAEGENPQHQEQPQQQSVTDTELPDQSSSEDDPEVEEEEEDADTASIFDF